MSKIKLNNVDLAWLRMDHATNPMIATVVLKFKGEINYDRLITNIEVSFKNFRRFRQRIIRPQGLFRRPYWEDDPDYRVAHHVERLQLELPADDLALEELVSSKMSTALDFSHPLWKATLVENYGEGSVIIVRMHHCIADGISLMQVLLRMTRTSPDEPASEPHPIDPVPDGQRGNDNSNITPTTTHAVDRGPAASPTLSAQPGKPAANPVRHTIYGKHTLINRIAAMVKIIFLSPDPQTILKGPLGIPKKAAWSEPYDLAEIRKIARIKHATPNDVLMAIASGTIRRYYELQHASGKRRIRAFVMVNLRRRFLDEELGNKFGLVFLTLPVDIQHPFERLDEVKRNMDGLKTSADYAATYQILNILGGLPEWIERLAVTILDTKGTVVATNVAGPSHELYLTGVPIHTIIAWVPEAGRIGVGWSFISYKDQVRVGINTDAGLVPDPKKFIELFNEEYRSIQDTLTTVVSG